MNILILFITTFVLFILAYRFYALYIVYRRKNDKTIPAVSFGVIIHALRESFHNEKLGRHQPDLSNLLRDNK